MENAVTIKNGVLAVLAAAGSVLAKQLGGWDAALKVLVGFMAADYITGLLVAAVWHKSSKTESGTLESGASFKGLLKKAVILMIVWMGALLDSVTTGTTVVRTAVCLFFIANEGLSILENTALMGVPYPARVKDMLEAMKTKADTENTADKNS